jgi:hypothetical protein
MRFLSSRLTVRASRVIASTPEIGQQQWFFEFGQDLFQGGGGRGQREFKFFVINGYYSYTLDFRGILRIAREAAVSAGSIVSSTWSPEHRLIPCSYAVATNSLNAVKLGGPPHHRSVSFENEPGITSRGRGNRIVGREGENGRHALGQRPEFTFFVRVCRQRGIR